MRLAGPLALCLGCTADDAKSDVDAATDTGRPTDTGTRTADSPTGDTSTTTSTTPAPGSCAPKGATLWSTWWLPGTDCVSVPAGTEVWLDVPADVVGIDIEGTLRFDCRDLTLQADRIDVRAGGRLVAGTADDPFLQEATLTLTDSSPAPACGGGDRRTLVVHGGGRLDLHGDYLDASGQPRVAWTRLAATAPAGSSSLTLQDDVDWARDDTLVIASTDFDLDQYEVRSLAKDASGPSVTLDAPLQVVHWGDVVGVAPDTVEMRAEVGLLSRNLRLTSDATDAQSGQIQALGPEVHLDWVEISNLGATNVLGVYPLHFHLIGDATGSYVRRASVHDNHFRGLTIHGTSNVEVRENVLVEAPGHLYYLEDGNEVGNQLVDNLGLGARSIADGLLDTDISASVFYVRHPDNVVEGNAAAGAEGHGFYLKPFAGERVPPTSFARNTSHSNGQHGFFQDDATSPASTATLSALTAYKNRQYGLWLRFWEEAAITDARVADNRAGFYLASGGWQARYSLITVEDAVLIGESDNVGTPVDVEEQCRGRSLPNPSEPTDYVSGFDIYDGLTVLRDARFYAFEQAVDCGGAVRPAGGISQTHKQNRWAVDPRNAFFGLVFDKTANEVWFRTPDPGITGVASAIVADPTGTLGTGRWIVPDNPLLVPPSGATFAKAWNAWQVDAADHHYAQLQVTQLDATLSVRSLFVEPQHAPGQVVQVNAPPTNPQDRFGLNVLADDAVLYTYDVSWPGPLPDRLKAELRFAEPGAAILLQIDYPAQPTSVSSAVAGGALTDAADPAAVAASATTAWAYEGPADRLHLKLVAPGGSLLDHARDETVVVEP